MPLQDMAEGLFRGKMALASIGHSNSLQIRDKCAESIDLRRTPAFKRATRFASLQQFGAE
jgi:hypothetical protein